MSELPPHKQWPSAWCNDTLSGRLLDWERPEDQHLRSKLGYWHMVEERMVRAELEAEGWTPPDPGFLGIDDRTLTDFEVIRRIGENHRGDATYREISAALASRSRRAERPPAFTREQLARLVELHAGANDPVTAGVAQVAQAMLDGRGPEEPS